MSDIHIVGIKKAAQHGEETYLWIFNEPNRAEALRSLGRAASNPELSFNWWDAAKLSQRIRATETETCVGR